MIVYRCLTSEEIIGMINNKKVDYPIRYGENTFNYEKDCEYKHFFVFVQHTKKYVKLKEKQNLEKGFVII